MLSCFSCVQLCATLWTVGHEAPLPMGFSRQEYWSGFPFPPPGDLPDPGIELRSPALQADYLPSEPLGKPFLLQRQESIAELCYKENLSSLETREQKCINYQTDSYYSDLNANTLSDITTLSLTY